MLFGLAASLQLPLEAILNSGRRMSLRRRRQELPWFTLPGSRELTCSVLAPTHRNSYHLANPARYLAMLSVLSLGIDATEKCTSLQNIFLIVYAVVCGSKGRRWNTHVSPLLVRQQSLIARCSTVVDYPNCSHGFNEREEWRMKFFTANARCHM